MVRIPDRPYGQLARGRLEAQSGGASDMYRIIGRTGKGLFSLAMTLREKKDHDVLVEAQNLYDKSMPEAGDGLTENLPDGPVRGFLPHIPGRHREALEESIRFLRDSGASDRAEQAFRNWAGEREAVGLAAAARYDYRQMLAHGKQAHDDRVQGIFRGLEENPESYNDALGQLEESYALAVGQGLYAPARARENFALAGENLRQAAFDGMYARDPGLAMRHLDALGFEPERKTAAVNRYAADQAGQAALDRTADDLRLRFLAGQAGEAEHTAIRDGDASGLLALAQEYAELGEQEACEELFGRAALYERNAAAIRQSRAMPLFELADIVRELETRLSSPVPGKEDGLAKGGEELWFRYTIYEDRLRALEHDPAKAVSREVEMIIARQDETDKGGGMGMAADNSSRIAELRLAAQVNSGLAWHKRRVLTNAEAAGLMESWLAGDAKQREEIATGLFAYGRHAGKAAREIGLSYPERFALARAGQDPAARMALRAMIAANAAPARELSLPEEAREPLLKAAENSQVLRAFMTASAMFPGDSGLQAAAASFAGTLSRLARAREGDAAGALSLLDGRLRAMTGEGFALVYDPHAYVHSADLEQGLRQARDGTALATVADSLDLPEGEREQWLSRLRSTGVWLNSPDGDGYVLYDPEAGQAVQSGRGELFLVRDHDIRTARTLARMRNKRAEHEGRTGIFGRERAQAGPGGNIQQGGET